MLKFYVAEIKVMKKSQHMNYEWTILAKQTLNYDWLTPVTQRNTKSLIFHCFEEERKENEIRRTAKIYQRPSERFPNNSDSQKM